MNNKLFTSSLVKQAVYFSAERHDGQYRKGTIVPFFVHPMLVALGVSEYTNDPNLIAAAVLHDVLEDCGVSVKELTKVTNEIVVKIVEEVTILKINSDNLSWKNRKNKYIEHIINASDDALLIVAIDKMNNMKSYFEHALKNNPEDLNKLFDGAHEDYIWYYTAIGKILKTRLNEKPVVNDYINLLSSYTTKTT